MQIKKWFGASLLFVLLVAFALMSWSAVAQPCPEGCRCLTEANAKELFGEGNFQMCQTSPCGEERSPTGAMLLKYCFKAKCPQGCSCVTEEKAKEMRYSLCSGQRISCGYDELKKPLFCFSPTSQCPAECRCLTEEEAKKQVYDKFCQNEKKECGNDAQGYPKFCYQIPALVCPAGCVCMSKEEAVAKGLKDNCLDAMGNPIVCGVIDTGNGLFRYCFKNPEQVMCQYDYKLGRCVGDCSAGKKCQLNTIYRDPKTGKVIRAECHCK